MRHLTSLGARLETWVASRNPWSNGYGLPRTLLALSTLLTLVFSPVAGLFRPGVGVLEAPICQGASRAGIFCLGSHHLEATRWIVVILLAIVASGWRPRVTALLHVWIVLSVQFNALMVDGGDQVCQVLTLLLLPVALSDRRVWHWFQPDDDSDARPFARVLALSTLVAIQIQVAGIYFHAAIAKFSVPEWVDGTALYYWLLDGPFGAPHWLGAPLGLLLRSGTASALVCWSVLLLEYLLSAALLMPEGFRRPLLVVAVTFHAAIAVTLGLVSFGLAMTAAIFLYLRPLARPFALPTAVGRRRPGSKQEAKIAVDLVPVGHSDVTAQSAPHRAHLS